MSDLGLNGRVGKMCIIQGKTDHISEMVRHKANVAINHL